ncbi:MAG: ribonuclease III [Clostridiales bacterium]|nr:ribonuclease III [Clostridiales bacterium]
MNSNEYTASLDALQQKIGYSFKNKALLCEALRHSSYTNERRSERLVCNERLEFLGDAVLSAIVSEYLFTKYPHIEEDALSSIRRETVDSRSLSGFAKSIDLGSCLLLGHGEEQNGGRERQSNLEDAFEALIAAIYLDGGKAEAEKFIIPFAESTAVSVISEHKLSDAKSKLQKIVQRGGGELPKYVITGESGPDHDKRFECDVLVENNVMGHGVGTSKKEAEKMAAEEALLYFGDIEE